jgi:hypothetical protein
MNVAERQHDLQRKRHKRQARPKLHFRPEPTHRQSSLLRMEPVRPPKRPLLTVQHDPDDQSLSTEWLRSDSNGPYCNWLAS